ncbi:MAG: DUF87 domain-containing protein, partial [bacterium]
MNDLRGPRVIFEITPPKQTALSPLTTTELFNILFGVISSRTLLDRLTLRSLSLSFEIVSQKESGIRYLVSVPTQISPQIDRTLRGYLPGMSIRVAEDYVITDSRPVVTQYKLGKHFAYPINTQEQLGQHDPLAYLTASMSKLESDELMAIQVVMRPQVRHQQAKKIRSQIESGRYLQATSTIPLLNWTESFVRLMVSPLLIVADAITGQPPLPKLERVERLLTKQESQYAQLIQSKLSQPLFRVSIRTMVIAKRSEASSRDKGLRASFVSFAHETGQVLRPQYEPRIGILQRFRNWQLSKRLLSSGQIVSSSEIAALYHFPYLTSHHAEDLIRVKSPEFPAPLSLKNNPDLDVMFGKNTFANSSVSVGLTDEDRSRHVYLIGQTGSGKSTVMYHMAKDDIRKGRGLAVIDPHGDLAEDLLATIPEERRKDLIYFNPFDIKFPVGINLLELTPYEDEDDRELERELVCESVISVFRRVFSKDENTDAHRIEYILRNAIYTAFTVKDSTI